MKTAVVYARQSFGVEADSVSIEVQKENCLKWCRENSVEVIGVYEDCNTSSELYPLCADGLNAEKADRALKKWKMEQKTKGRKEYKEALGKCFEIIASRKPTYIVVNSKDRLGRTVDNGFLNRFIFAYMIDHNCTIFDVKENHASRFDDRAESLVEEIKASVQYGDLMKRRIASLESIEKRKNSYRAVSNAFGVQTVNHVISFKKRESELIKFVFAAVIAGKAYSNILHTLNTDFSDCLPVFKRKGKQEKAKQFYATNVSNILANVIYAGYTYNVKGEIGRATNVPNPIISLEMYMETQKLIKEKKAGYQKYNLKGQKKRHFLPFSGYLYCECGRKLTVLFDDGIVYHCVNGGTHAVTLRTNACNNGQDMYTALQAIFVLNVIKQRKKLACLDNATANISKIDADIANIEQQITAKIALCNAVEDVEQFAPIIAGLQNQKKELKNKKQELTALQDADAEALRSSIDDDLVAITSKQLLAEDDYNRLLQATIEKIIVKDDALHIILKDGNSFDLPRMMVDKRGKKIIPFAEVQYSEKSVYNDAVRYNADNFYYINFYCSPDSTKQETLLETEDYSIILYR